MYYFIINPKSKSGRGLFVWNTVKQELDKKHISYSYYVTTHKGHATKFANMICQEFKSKKYIIVVGGDGTVNEVVNGISDFSSVIFGYITTGSGNDLAKGLGIPLNPVVALHKIIDTQRYMYVDQGQMTMLDSTTPSSRKFCASSGIGLDASICNKAVDSNLKNFLNRIRLGKLSYLLITFRQVLTLEFCNATITADGVTKKYKNLAFAASLIQKCEGGGLCMAPNAKFNDQKLSICLVHGISRGKILFLLPTLLFGKHIKFEGVEVFDCTSIEIKTDKKQKVHVDGEYIGTTSHLINTCLPKQVRMPV